MDIIPIPGSAMPCERVFSSAKETVTPHRNRIKPELMEALQLLKFSAKHGHRPLDFTTGESWDEEEAQLMTLVNELGTVAEDAAKFQEKLCAKPKPESP